MSWLYLLLFLLIPILLSILLNVNNKNLHDECIIMLKNLSKIIFILFLIFFVKLFITNKNSQADIEAAFYNVIEYACLIGMIIFVNHFSTRYNMFRICINEFLKSLIKFMESNFFLSMFIFILIIFVNMELRYALIGSYLFFVLTEVYSDYKKNIENYNFKCDIIHGILQFVLNTLLVIVFLNVEEAMLSIYTGNPMMIEKMEMVHFILFLLIIVVSSFYPNIEKILKLKVVR